MRRTFLIAGESALLLAAGTIAAYVRLGGAASWELSGRLGWLKLVFITLMIQSWLYLFDWYNPLAIQGRKRLLASLIGAFGSAALMVAVLFYWIPELQLGRGVFLINIAFGAVIVIGWRLCLEWISNHQRIQTRERVLILGSGEHAVEMARITLERRDAGFHVVGFVDDKPELLGKSLINPSVIGMTQDLIDLVFRHRVDRIVVAIEDRRGKFPIEELLNLSLSGRVAVEESACYYERLTGKVGTEILRPSWLIFSRSSRDSAVARRIRRFVNAGLAAIGLVLSLPFMILIALAIKLDGPGPVFYRQKRVGRNGRSFNIVKFRSMCVDAERDSGPVWAEPSDPRVTRVGRVIRRLRLDELPQFLNVLKGDMNFIGPRPERPEFVEKLSEVAPYYSQRHLIKPGLTGWAQIKYSYAASVEDAIEKLRYDLYYIKNRSLLLDSMIVFETIKIVLFGRGAR